MAEDGARRYLRYFNRRVLARYEAEPDKYEIRADGVEGTIMMTDAYAREVDAHGEWDTEIGQMRYGFRRLGDGTMCIAAMTHDLARLPDDHKPHWLSELLRDPVFADSDPVFEQLEGRWLTGSWDEPDSTIPRMRDLIRLVNACFPRETPLLRRSQNPLLRYPSSDNRRAYHDVVEELNKLLWENLDGRAIHWLAGRAGRPVRERDGSGNRLGHVRQLESVLPHDVRSACIEPMARINKVRTEVHEVGSPPRERKSYWHIFDQDLREVCDGLEALLAWTEQTLRVDARRIQGWRDKMAWLPQIVGPPNPQSKDSSVQECVGRTVERVEFGQERSDGEMHEREALILHFSDGSVLGISVQSNARNLAGEYNLTPPEVHTQLMPWWVGPKPAGAD